MKLPFSILKKRQEKQRNKKAFTEAISIIGAVKKMVDVGALVFDRKDRRVGIVTEMFWEGRSEEWRTNFCQNLHLFMDIQRDAVKYGENLKAIQIHRIDIDKKQISEKIATYYPNSKLVETI